MTIRKWTNKLWLTAALTLGLLLAACGGGAEEIPTAEEAPVSQPPADGQVVTLVENPWPSSELNVRVAKTIIENELNQQVELVALDENLQWDAISGGDADASLEVWPSGHGERIQQYIEEQGVVEDGGPLGPQGIIGWYVPTYVVEANPALASWEGFQDPELAGLFATAETGDKGQFLAGDPSWVQYDADIIENLGLELEVVTAGSEDALLAAVSSAYSREEPILFYFYEPHALFAEYELTQVQLPPYSEECYSDADSGGVDCAYPVDQLMKIFATDLSEEAPDAYTVLNNMNYSNSAQIDMLAMLDEGMTLDEAAQTWVEQNEAVWREWLP